MEFKELKADLTSKIADSRLEEALEVFDAFLSGPNKSKVRSYQSIHDQVLQLQSRMAKANADVRKGIVENDEATLVRNRINNDILTLLRDLRPATTERHSRQVKTDQKKTRLLLLALTFLLLFVIWLMRSGKPTDNPTSTTSSPTTFIDRGTTPNDRSGSEKRQDKLKESHASDEDLKARSKECRITTSLLTPAYAEPELFATPLVRSLKRGAEYVVLDQFTYNHGNLASIPFYLINDSKHGKVWVSGKDLDSVSRACRE